MLYYVMPFHLLGTNLRLASMGREAKPLVGGLFDRYQGLLGTGARVQAPVVFCGVQDWQEHCKREHMYVYLVIYVYTDTS